MLNFYAQQLQVARAMRESGECLVRFRMRRVGDGIDVPLQLQVLEADYLDTSRTGLYEGGVNIAGIGFDALGRHTGYWLFDQHPGDFIRINANIQSKFVPASEVLHIYDATTRPNTIRGLPEFAVSIWAARDTEEYRDAQRVAKKIQAMWVAFATTADENFSAGRKVGRNDAGPISNVEEVTPGTLTRLRVGEDVKFSAPAQILDYEPYMRTEHRGIAAGSDVTYEQMTGDFSQVNFTSGRMGKIEFRRVLEQQQELIFIPMLCDAVAERWCKVGYLSNPKFRKVTYMRDWTAPRIEMTDPLRETTALAMMVDEHLISRQEAQRQIGQTPEIMDREIENDPLRSVAPETPDKPPGNDEAPPDDSKPGSQDNAPAANGSETRAARKNRSPLLRALLFGDKK